ncbi:prolipoprotein diacylglyceryl transferase [Xylanimonas allomyrinae]|uniref:Phosphatidylglycerol--prolipoprotein diacylglyceryl transferase n=1 Tax=Xylanimonas allomyrinae TaxID=2509459 RepID=A0A4P6EIS8_9MICO|nr:prolipoprotein diacylglyceryl transferase [Xylanimonas allomyrinae]QAY62500.1 prolipoprotein diacylglyceryl transferase [Xylanimonas allomyrinae]
MLPLSIPSPSQGVWHLGALPLRAYAFAILAGIVLAAWIAGRRFTRRTAGGTFDDVLEITFWAVPFGIVGGRIYHVITTPGPYFGAGGDPIRALFIWEGGLGIWGAVALGGLGAWIGARRQNVRLPVFADALAPGLLVAQAVGRLGNWFNQELYGAPTTLPWGLQIDAAHLVTDPATGLRFAEGTLFHPTFLYELLWNLAMAGVLVWIDRKFRLGHGRVFWAYVALYTLGRGWIEALRIDTAEHLHLFGTDVRLNVITSIVVFAGGVVAFVLVGRRFPEREADARRVVPALTSDEVPDDAPDDVPDEASGDIPDDAPEGDGNPVAPDDPVTGAEHP